MRTREVLEVAAVILTAALHFVFYELLPGRGAFIVVTVLAWSTYFAVRVRRSPQNRREFGLSAEGLRPSAVAASIVLLVGIAMCFAIGTSRGTVRLVPQMLILAFLYPAWGLVQQLLVQSMVVRNLKSVLSGPVVVAIAGVLFGIVHLPDVELALATALLGGIFTLIFLRWRNVWPLGVCHGLLGVFFYFWVLGRNPLREIVAGG
jgi:hypothetical protein